MEARADKHTAMAATLAPIAGEALALADGLNNQADATLGGACVTAREHINRLTSLLEAVERIANPGRLHATAS
jgi:hypothetical protein